MNPVKRLYGLLLLLIAATASATPECVVLLHGLARSSSSMEKIETALLQDGYAVANIDYPSRKYEVSELSQLAIESGLNECRPKAKRIHFVAHSLGGILIRYYLEQQQISGLGRIVMIAPPNQGSQVVDDYRNIPGFRLLNGPAGLQLGTDPASIPSNLGPVTAPVGIIAGTRTFNPILSLSLPNPDDGKVSVEHTKVAGMQDFIQVPHTHTFMMRAPRVVQQTLTFLREGSFDHGNEAAPSNER